MDREKVIEMILDPGRRPAVGSAEHGVFLAQLENSPEYRAMYEQQQAVWEALDLWEPVEPSAGFDRGLYEKIERRPARRASVSIWSWLSLPAEWFATMRPGLAAGLAALLLIAGAIVTYQPRRAAEQFAARGSIEIGPEYSEEIEQALDDIEMLADFEALVLQAEGPGKS
jgi:hypothetical protein